MKKYFKFHFFFYITSFIFLFSGHFKDYIMIMGIVLFHELGHIMMGRYFKWSIQKIIILPFGCITKFKTEINVPLKEEFFVTIMGPFFQIIGAFFYYQVTKNELFLFYHHVLLFLNLLPIIPLDGSKIINVFFCKIFSYKKALFLSFKLSVLFLILTIFYEFYYFNFLLFIWTILLILENKKEKQFLLLKFYLFLKERMEHQYQFPYRYEKINNVDRIKRDVHCIFQNQYTERDAIKRYFHYEIR